MPKVVCLRDLTALLARLEHLLFGHPDEAPGREALDLVSVALAILAGARRVGFDVGPEERSLDRLLAELEKRGPAPR